MYAKAKAKAKAKENSLVLDQLKILEIFNEITVIPKLLKVLSTKNRIVTVYVMSRY